MFEMSMQLRGFEEVKRALELLPDKIARKVLRRSVAKGSNVMKRELMQSAPVRKTPGMKWISHWSGKERYGKRGPGFLAKKGVRYKYRRKKSKSGEVHYAIGPFGHGYYGFIVAYGHANAMAQDWITPAFERAARPTIHRIKVSLKEGILKEGQKLGFRTSRL